MKLWAPIILMFLSAPAVGEPAPTISIQDFASLPTVRSPILSPDGKRIAARMVDDGNYRIAVINADNPAAQPQIIPLGKTQITDLHWAGNNRLLLEVLSEAKIRGYEIPFTRLIVIDLATGTSRIADPDSIGLYAGDVLYVSPDGASAIVASQNTPFEFPAVKRVDLATGKAQVIEHGKTDVWDWFVDNKGAVRGALAYDNKRWKIWYRSKPDDAFETVKGKFDKEDDAVDKFLIPSDGDQGSIVTNERNGRFGVYHYDFKTGELGAPIFEHPEVDISDVILEPGTSHVVGVRYEDSRWHTYWADPALKALQEKLNKALPNTDNRILGDPDRDKRMLIWSGGAANPGSYFLFDQTKHTLSPVVTPYSKIPDDKLADVKPIHYVARDGLTIQGYLTIPKGKEAKSLPLILLPHGGPFSRDDWEYDPLVQFLANRGYAVLQPQFRGSTGYGKDLVSRGYGEWGRKMQDDLDDGVDWLAKTGQIDPKRVCIVGGSYGGYAALWGVIRNPERYRCAASIAGVTDLGAQLNSDRSIFSATRYFKDWRTQIQGDQKFDLKSVSPLYQVQRLTRPVLLVHGEKDQRVSIKQARTMVAAMQSAHADVTFAYYKDGGHDFSSSQDFADFLTRLEAFLAKHNPS